MTHLRWIGIKSQLAREAECFQSLEQIIRDDPEVIIIIAESLAEFRQAAGLIRHDKRLQKIQALQRNRTCYLGYFQNPMADPFAVGAPLFIYLLSQND